MPRTTRRATGTGYDDRGNPAAFTSLGPAGVVNQVVRAFDGRGRLAAESQAHGGPVGPGTPAARYLYAAGPGGAQSRLAGVVYPGGRAVEYAYAPGADDAAGRVSAVADATGVLEGYAYLGAGAVVERARPQPGGGLTYVAAPGVVGDAGDRYAGVDRFGRAADHRWVGPGGADLARQWHGYDRAGRRAWRDDRGHPAASEAYAHDGLGQLVGFARGALTPARDGVAGPPARAQAWQHDGAGNWAAVATDGAVQGRSHDARNRVTAVGGATPAYDGNGALTGDGAGRQFRYDAWGRLVGVQAPAGATAYAYDALGRRVREDGPGGGREFFHSAGWQVLEERAGGRVTAQYVWSPTYVDDLILRDRDTDGDGILDERLWAVQDANHNVTAVVDAAGAVAERFAYDPYGAATVLTPTYDIKPGGSSYAWEHLFQGRPYSAATGLYHVRHRDLDPVLGRWLTPDPLGFGAGDPNLYRAMGNRPATLTDPSGLQPPGLFQPPPEVDRLALPGEKPFGQMMVEGMARARRDEPYRFFAKGAFEAVAPTFAPYLAARGAHEAAYNSYRSDQLPLADRAAGRAALRAAVAGGDAELYGRLTGAGAMLLVPAAPKTGAGLTVAPPVARALRLGAAASPGRSGVQVLGGVGTGQTSLNGLHQARNLTPGRLQVRPDTCGLYCAQGIIDDLNPGRGRMDFGLGRMDITRPRGQLAANDGGGLTTSELMGHLDRHLPDAAVVPGRGVSEGQFLDYTARGQVIAHVDGNHWVRVTGTAREGRTTWVRVSDPARGNYEQELTHFMMRMSPGGGENMIISVR